MEKTRARSKRVEDIGETVHVDVAHALLGLPIEAHRVEHCIGPGQRTENAWIEHINNQWLDSKPAQLVGTLRSSRGAVHAMAGNQPSRRHLPPQVSTTDDEFIRQFGSYASNSAVARVSSAV